MTTQITAIRQMGAALIVMIILGFGVWGLVLTVENDAATVTAREALPAMTRAGAVSVNNTTLNLWKFEFEGQQCLWVSAPAGRGGRGGLTCWEPKP